MAVMCKTQKWGNSVGIRIPKAELESHNIGIGEEVMVNIEKKSNPLRELFGTMKTKKTARTMIAQARKEMKSKFDG